MLFVKSKFTDRQKNLTLDSGLRQETDRMDRDGWTGGMGGYMPCHLPSLMEQYKTISLLRQGTRAANHRDIRVALNNLMVSVVVGRHGG